ncbi:microtubule-associated tumor suppressor 1 homolog A isoform X2 [Megalops cyprinoides]|uniref:microtubule-associated tumor suppressor 1 homolog A isoform X2 n=1 Tax=Megalops cyprinoides TaxID=118141 RepID=UPI001865378E|nr:microtubule-associated tumor suppressor 1 homolog A isoform X2 [Megalops cyprinoides]
MSVSSLPRDTVVNGNCLSPVSNITVNGILAPSEHSLQNETFQEDSRQDNALRPLEKDAVGNGTVEKSCGENQDLSSASVSSKLSAASDGSRGRLGQRPSPGRARGATSSQTPTEILRLPPPVAKLKLGTSSKDGRTSGSMSVSRTKQISAAGNQKMRLTERPSVAAAVVTGTKPPLNPVSAATSSKLPVKFHSPSVSLSPSPLSSIHSEPGVATGSTRAGVYRTENKIGGPVPKILGKPPINKVAGTRNGSPQRKGRPAGCKTTALQNQMPTKSIGSPLQRTGSARFQRPTAAPPVDKNKQKTGPRTQQPQTNGHPDLLPAESKPLGTEHYRAQCEKSNQCIQQLKKLLISGNRRFEAITVVIQHIIAERDEAQKQCQELSQELVTLREELVTSATSCETLEKEKDELHVTFEGVLQKVQEQHQSDLADLEERLKAFYSAEWEKVHEAYQEEADKYKNQMQQQVDDLRSKHEALRKELEASHAEKVESLTQQYETTFEDLRKAHEQEIQTLDKSLKDAETKLSEQIEELMTENNTLKEKVEAEEERRRMLAEKNQDSHTLYLEQELESLKVVLDIKNKQLHQQDKKLMQMDKLMEKNVKLDESLKKIQQENEDLKARMDKHAALSRQLSTEQAVLQESLQKESKVNKRLSMENEELLWKLHNGDLTSPRKLSPSSPSKSFQSPRNSGVFSSAPVSPR